MSESSYITIWHSFYLAKMPDANVIIESIIIKVLKQKKVFHDFGKRQGVIALSVCLSIFWSVLGPSFCPAVCVELYSGSIDGIQMTLHLMI